jgi:glycosyltransferase involved in cell wall biosynthesis
MKVCLVSCKHSLLDARITYKEALSLARAGYEVVVVGRINHDGVIYDLGRTPISKVNEAGYLPWNGILLKGVAPYKIKSLAGKIHRRFVTGALAFLGEAAIAENADVYHCHELDSLEAVIRACRRRKSPSKAKIIFDSHEYWPYHVATARTKTRGKIYARLAFWYETLRQAHLMTYCDGIIVVNRIMWSYFLLRHPLIPVEVIYNAASGRIFDDVTPAPPFEHGQTLNLIHEGFLSFDRGLAEMLALMKMLEEAAPGRTKLTIVGQAGQAEEDFFKLKLREYNLNSDQVQRTGWVPYDQIGRVNAQGHVGLITMHPLPGNMLGSSNKLFNYIYAGLAIIAPDYPGTAYLVRKWQAGAIVRPQNVEDYARIILHWLEHPNELNQLREQARQASAQGYNWESMEPRLFQFYKRILG